MAGSSGLKLASLVPFLRLMNQSRLAAVPPQCLFQHVRHKGQRFKLPPEPKEKEKRIRKTDEASDKVIRNPKELEEFMKRVPVDDVWLREHYPVQKYGFADVIRMHRELASLEMFDNVDGLLVVDTELDMSTKKKTKFLGSIKGTVMFPHSFDDGIQNRVVAITKNSEDQEAARKFGAEFVGGLDIIKLIERGEIRPDDYTHLVCNVDLLTEVTIIKKHLKDNFPSRKKGNLGSDVGSLVNLFVKGRSFESVKVTDAVSKLTIVFGRLNMSDDQLRENLQSFIDCASSLKSPTYGKLISKLTVRCPPSTEAFVLRSNEFVAKLQNTDRRQELDTAIEDATEDKAEEDDVELASNER